MNEKVEELELWKSTVQQDIHDLKQDRNKMKDDIHQLQMSDKVQNQRIDSMDKVLFEIKDDTKWTRRMLTKTIVGAIITAFIGGTIALFFANL